MDDIQELESIISNCIRCGFCRSVCPVFQSLGVESTVARGKIGLIGTIIKGRPITKGLMKRLSLCLLCKSCVVNCPAGVQVDKAVMAARSILFKRIGAYPIKKLIFRGFLKPKGVMPLSLSLGSRVQGLFIRSAGRPGYYKIRLPIAKIDERVIPGLSGDRLQQVYRPLIVQGKVALFTGCLMKYCFTDMAKSTIEVLNKLNIEVHIPNQQCCGLPALANGDTDSAIGLIKGNVHSIYDYITTNGIDRILVACASCGSMLKNEWKELLSQSPHSDGDLEKINYLGNRIKDINEYLIDELKIDLRELTLNTIRKKVTYHDPCHLVRGQNIHMQPRKLLELIPGITFIEMNDAARCCGSGGSFSLAHYDLSRKINDVKINDILVTQSDTVVTSCPGCIMHITDGLNMNSSELNVCHVMELLNEALQ